MNNKYLVVGGIVLLVLGGLAWAVLGITGSDQKAASTNKNVNNVAKTETKEPEVQVNKKSVQPVATVTPSIGSVPSEPITNKSGSIEEDISNIQSELGNLDKNTLKDSDLEGIDSGLGSSY